MKHFFSLKAVAKLSTYFLFCCLVGCGSESPSEQVDKVQTPISTTPVADAGADKTVQSGAVVLLTGVASDSDGTIDGYLWQQVSGPTVTIVDISDTDIQFTSPTVTEETTLEFQLSVIDNSGEQTTDNIVILVSPANSNNKQLNTTVTLQPDTEIEPHTSELVTFALPIAEGVVHDISEIQVIAMGLEQPIVAKAGLRWHWSDNSIRSVTIQLQNVDMTLGNILLTITNNGRDTQKDLIEQPHNNGWAIADANKANMPYPRIFAIHDKSYLATSGLIPQYASSEGESDQFEQYQVGQFKRWSGGLNFSISSGANWLFDRSTSYFKAYMTTGRVEFLKEAILSKQFYFSHVRNDSSSPSQSGGRGCWTWGVACADGKYIYTQPAKLAWALTGDNSQWDNSLIIDMALQSDLGWNQYGSRDDFNSENEGFTERGAGMAGLAEVGAYEITADTTIYSHINQRIASLAKMQQDEHAWDKTNGWLPKTGGFEHNLDVHEGNHSASNAPINDSNSRGFSTWMSENIADFLWQSYWVTNNQEIPEMLKKLGNAVDLYGFTSMYDSTTNEHLIIQPFSAVGDIRTKSCNKANTATDLLYFASAWASDQVRVSGDYWPYYSDTHNIETVLILATAYYFEDNNDNKKRLSARIEKLISGWVNSDCASVFSNVHRLFNWQHRSNSVRTWQWINNKQPTVEPPLTTEPPKTDAMVSFEEVSEQVIDFAPIAHQPFWIGMPDVNNDGCPDLFSGTHNDNAGTSQMWLHKVIEGKCSNQFAYYNNNDGKYSQLGSGRITSRYIFSNITKKSSGLPDMFGSDADGGDSVIYPLLSDVSVGKSPVYSSEIKGCIGGKARCSALDINGDGNIELIVSSTVSDSRRRIYDPLTNTTIVPGLLDENASGYGASSYLIVDVDGDSWPDVVAGQSNGYWRYNPAKADFDSFTVAFTHPVTRSVTPNMQVPLDYDNDGDFDILFGYGSWSIAETKDEFYLSLHRNNGNGTFTDVTKTAGGGSWTDGSLKNQNHWTTYGGIYPGDFNNDGFIDFMTMTQSYSNSPRIFQNNGNGTFTLLKNLIVNGGAGVDVFRPWGNVGDWNNDGFLDMAILSNGSGDIKGLKLYKNDANDNHWMKIRARGLNNNTDGYHTKFVFKNSANQQIITTRYLGNFNQADARFIAYAGLGAVTSVDLTVEFPHNGPQYQYSNLDVDKELIVFRDGCLIKNWQPGQGWPTTSAEQACTRPD